MADVANKQGKANHQPLVMNITHVATPDSEDRLRRVLSILLKAAARSRATPEVYANSANLQPRTASRLRQSRDFTSPKIQTTEKICKEKPKRGQYH